MFVGIKGGGKCRTAGFDKRLCGHLSVRWAGKEVQSAAHRARALSVSCSKSLLHCKHARPGSLCYPRPTIS